MRLVSYFSSSDPVRGPARRRIAAFALTIAAHVLIILLLMTLTLPPPRPRIEPRPNIFQILPEPKPVEEPRAIAPKPVKREAGGSQPRAANPRPATATPPPPQAPAKSPFGLIPGGIELFDAADIGKLPAHPEDRDDGGSGDGAGKSANSGSVYGPGEGPGGDRLYDVDWVKRPTNAELSPYMPASVPPGSWAIIACRMVEHYQVENCRALSESPPGSGLARGLRQAAWQFRVFPPRLGKRPIIGGWVRIRMDFTEKGDPGR